MIKVSFPFDAVTHAQLRRIRPRGYWRGSRVGWEFPLAAANSLQNYLGNRFVVEEELTNWLSLFNHPLPPLPRHRFLISEGDLDKELLDGRHPLSHQRVGARWLLARRGAVLADEMGLGKTLTALLAARAMVRAANVKVMVIAPVGLHNHWLYEAKALGLSIHLQSWAKLPKELPKAGTVLIVDEAHFAQNIKAKRTQAMLRLARHPRLRAIWLITGTPFKNGRPSQLFPLLAAIDHPLARDQVNYEKSFCNGHWVEKQGRQVWDCLGVSNLSILRQLIRPLFLSRRKQYILDLPPKYRFDHKVVLTDSQALGFDHRIDLVIDDYRRRVQEGLVSSDAESLAILTSLRRIGSEFKLPAVKKFLEDRLRKSEAVVIFSNFVEPLELLQSSLGGELLTGRQKLVEREEAVNNFQGGSSSLLFATFAAGGLGFTLHKARHVVLLERPWSPGDVLQAEDRCHRIGMDSALNIHWFKLGFADQLVDALVSTKNDTIEVLLGHDKLRIKRQSLAKMLLSCVQDA